MVLCPRTSATWTWASKLDLEPLISVDDEVTIKVGWRSARCSSRSRPTRAASPTNWGTRGANTVLRLRDGETQVLAGLISKEETRNASRIPGLGDLPLVGRLFSSQLNNGSRTELVLAITPRLVRNVRRPSPQRPRPGWAPRPMAACAPWAAEPECGASAQRHAKPDANQTPGCRCCARHLARQRR